ncbi:hypothetical protein Sango_1814600 [Sesamum angolense]|uniref:Uncharacterized protein n=1 Tax=Sesamum angolense TaxID=2727404 RepID=A0AAE2BQ13_9LAMI|nr:hypothetical protein Sango_1814600 [Sesamum angolense]
MNGILGLCWLKQQPSKSQDATYYSVISYFICSIQTLLHFFMKTRSSSWWVSDGGSLRLYDINCVRPKVEDGYCNPAVVFDDFEQLTSVHINSTDDRCLTSGYSKKVAIYDICTGQRLQLFTDMHREPINKPWQPCYTASSSRGNVMVVFSPDDLYLLVSAVDNEVKQLLAVDGRLHMDLGIVSTGSAHNYTRSYYMNGRDYIITGSCEEPTIRICCAQTGRLRDISLEDTGWGSSIFVQSLRSDPFRHFHMAVWQHMLDQSPSTKSLRSTYFHQATLLNNIKEA